jgi:hypothetical protein
MIREQINALIKEIHKERKERGEWEGLPKFDCEYDDCPHGAIPNFIDGLPVCQHFYGDDYAHGSCKRMDEKRNAYLAQKLDLITEAIVDAMRLRRYGKTIGQEELNCFIPGDYEHFILNTYEDLISLAAIRTMDLMGFYNVEYRELDITTLGIDGAGNLLRLTLHAVAFYTTDVIRGVSTSYVGDGIISRILHIAQLDNIDLSWHINARREYERS